MNMQATFINEDGSETTYQGEQAWAMIQAQSKPYSGVSQLKQIPSTKENYKAKNGAGGRKAMFTQARDYKSGKFDGCAIPWGEGSSLFNQCVRVRAELENAIAKGA